MERESVARSYYLKLMASVQNQRGENHGLLFSYDSGYRAGEALVFHFNSVAKQ